MRLKTCFSGEPVVIFAVRCIGAIMR